VTSLLPLAGHECFDICFCTYKVMSTLGIGFYEGQRFVDCWAWKRHQAWLSVTTYGFAKIIDLPLYRQSR